jgi:hypothetical protein
MPDTDYLQPEQITFLLHRLRRTQSFSVFAL